MHSYKYWRYFSSPVTMAVRLVAARGTGVVSPQGMIKSVDGVSSREW